MVSTRWMNPSPTHDRRCDYFFILSSCPIPFFSPSFSWYSSSFSETQEAHMGAKFNCFFLCCPPPQHVSIGNCYCLSGTTKDNGQPKNKFCHNFLPYPVGGPRPCVLHNTPPVYYEARSTPHISSFFARAPFLSRRCRNS